MFTCVNDYTFITLYIFQINIHTHAFEVESFIHVWVYLKWIRIVGCNGLPSIGQTGQSCCGSVWEQLLLMWNLVTNGNTILQKYNAFHVTF